MQKLLRRVHHVNRQAARRGDAKAAKREWMEKKAEQSQESYKWKQIHQERRDARRARREDWELGPLAPLRDVGAKKDTYGAVNNRRLRGSNVPVDKRTKYWNIALGDRVVVLEGRDKGKIGLVKSKIKETEEVTVGGLNLVDVELPEYMREHELDKRPIRTAEAAIPLRSVRLVHPLFDETTGVKRDVIIKELAVADMTFNPLLGKNEWERVVPGLGIRIPWPERAPRREVDESSDTLRIDVERKTFVPTLLRPPMPPEVIDELRNKYSKFRTRHDEEYLAKKRSEDEEVWNKKEMAKLMEPPVKTLNRQLRREAKKEPKPKLSDETLLRIGETMARNKGLISETAVVSPETLTAS